MPSKHAKVDAVDGTVREGRHFSPFLSTDDAPSAYERAKMVVMAPVAVVRIAAMSMVFLFLATVGWVATRGADVDRPYGSLRRLVVRCNVWACSCLALLIGGVWLRVEGRENVPPARRAKAIGVFNHLSYLDILILVYTFGATFIAKGGVDRIPLVGSVAKALQCIFVARAGTADRSSSGRSGGTTRMLAERARDERFPPVFVAPEATTQTGKCLLRFQRGAFACGAPVLPVLIRFPYRHFNPAWGVTDTSAHLFRCACQVVIPARVTILPHYYPSPSERANPSEYAENVRSLMAKHLQVPLCDQGVEDCQALLDQGVYSVNGRVLHADPARVKAAAGMQGDSSSSSTAPGPGRPLLGSHSFPALASDSRPADEDGGSASEP